MTLEGIQGLEAHFRGTLGIPVSLAAVRGDAAPRGPWPGLGAEIGVERSRDR